MIIPKGHLQAGQKFLIKVNGIVCDEQMVLLEGTSQDTTKPCVIEWTIDPLDHEYAPKCQCSTCRMAR